MRTFGPIALSSQSGLRHVRFGSKADICSAQTNVRFTPNSDHKSGHPLVGRMVLWFATEEFDHARTREPYATHTHRCPLEQGQVNRSQAAAQAKACLGNPRHAPKWAETRPCNVQSCHRQQAAQL